MRSVLIAFCAVLLAAGSPHAARTQAQTSLTLNEHPRLGMASSDLPAIVARLSSGGAWHGDFASYVSYLESGDVWNSPSETWDDLGMWAMGAAFVYALRTKGSCCSGVRFGKSSPEYADKALAWITRLKDLDRSPPNHLVEHQYHATFFVYDWIHDRLDQATRTAFIDYWKSLDGFAPVVMAAKGAPQWANEQHSRGYGRKVLAGLACHGDGIDDAWCRASHETYPRFIRHKAHGMVSRETERGGTDSSWIQGINYGLNYDAHHLAIVEMGWRTASGISKAMHYTAADAGYWLGLARLATWFQRPWPSSGSGSSRRWMYLKDVYTNHDYAPHQAAQDLVWWGLLRRELQGVDDDAASLAAWTIANRAYGSGADKRFWIHTKFLGDKNVEKGPEAIGLPLRKAFKFGAWMWRTGWSNVNDALVTVYGYEFSGFRSAVGSFSIDYMGPSVILPGAGGHDIDSAWHGFANTLGAPENRSTPETKNPANTDDYGFHRSYNPITPDFVQNTVVDWLDRSERFVEGEGQGGYGYLRIDRSRSMNGTLIHDPPVIGSAPKIRSAVRSFALFLPESPGKETLRVVISDRMSTLDTKFEKRWVLYYSGTPTIDGTSSPGPARGAPASSAGKMSYTGATTITSTSGDASARNRTWVKPVHPSGSTIVLVNFRRDNQVEDSYGLMHGTSGFNRDNVGYVGTHRTEIIPSTPQLDDQFVNVIEVGPSNASASPTEAIAGSNFKGARVGNRIAVFGTSDVVSAGSFTVPTAGTYRVVISDLPPLAAVTVKPGSAITDVVSVPPGTGGGLQSSAQGVLYVQFVVASSGTGPANTIELSATAQQAGWLRRSPFIP